jgi:hypothetical protein
MIVVQDEVIGNEPLSGLAVNVVAMLECKHRECGDGIYVYACQKMDRAKTKYTYAHERNRWLKQKRDGNPKCLWIPVY